MNRICIFSQVQFEEVLSVFVVTLVYKEVKTMHSLSIALGSILYFVFVTNINRMFVTAPKETMFKLFMFIPL